MALKFATTKALAQEKRAQGKLAQQRRYMVLNLPRWATDYLKRHDRELADLRQPFALYERQNNAMRLVALDVLASRSGLSEGLSLSDARAMCPGLVAQEIDRGFLASVFADFADWHSYASPIVAVMAGRDNYGDLVLDITGVAHLFGDEAKMLRTIIGRIEGFGFCVLGAIASSIGAAWALSHFAPGQVVGAQGEISSPSPLVGEGDASRRMRGALETEQVAPPSPGCLSLAPTPNPSPQGGGEQEEVDEALAPLPVAALRLEDAQVTGLRQMGLKTIGQLYGRNRQQLQARFGVSLLTRLDQALGHSEERVVPRLPVPEQLVERKFAEPIGLIDDVMMSVQDLAYRLSGLLEGAGCGAQTFHLMLYRVDHTMMVLSVNAARSTRDAAHIGRLFANRIDRLTGEFDAGFGIDVIRLAATSVFEIDDVQTSVFGSNDGAADLDRLFDRLASRLGPQVILRSKPVNTHIPERAVVLEPIIARTPDDIEALPDTDLPRPLRLLPQPEEILIVAEVPDGPPIRMEWRRLSYRFVKASGPERIAVEWWHPGEKALTRDYYVGEDEAGHRFWLFREGQYVTETNAPRWFLHGLFA